MRCAQCHASPERDPFVCGSCGVRLYAFLGQPFDRGATVGQTRRRGHGRGADLANDEAAGHRPSGVDRCLCCQYEAAQVVRCPRCRSTFDPHTLKELGHLEYLQAEVPSWVAAGIVSSEAGERIVRDATSSIKMLRLRLGLPARVASLRLSAPVGAAPDLASTRLDSTDDTTVQHAAPTTTHPFVPTEGSCTSRPPSETPSVHEAPVSLAGPSPASPPPSASKARPTTVAAHTVPTPRGIMAGLFSERTLHALLGLGAFLVLASGTVISTLNPTGLSPLIHAFVVVITAMLFYAAGLVVRERLHLPLAGAALLAIGGVFAPLAAWTFLRQILGWSPVTAWLATSLVCLPLYLATHLRLGDRAAAVYVAVAGGSAVMALQHQLGVPLPASFVGVLVLTLAYVWFAYRPGTEHRHLRMVLSASSQVAVPTALFVLIYPIHQLRLSELSASVGWSYSLDAARVGWWLGVAFYALSAQLTGRLAYRTAAAWLLPAAFVLTLTATDLEVAWYPPLLIALALVYLLAARWRTDRTDKMQSRPVETEPFVQVAVALTLLSVVWPVTTPNGQIVSWLLVAMTAAAGSILLRHRAPAWVSVLMLVGVWVRMLVELHPQPAQLPAAWFVAAVALLAAAELRARQTGDAALPLRRLLAVHSGQTSRSRFVPPLFVTGYALLFVTVFEVIRLAPSSPLIAGVPSIGLVASLPLGGVATVCAATAVARRVPRLVSLTALLVVGAVLTGTVDLADRLGRRALPSDLAIVLCALAFAYLFASHVLERTDLRLSTPFFLGGYGVLVAAQLLAARDPVLRVLVGGAGLVALAMTTVEVDRGSHATFSGLLRALLPAGPPEMTASFFAAAVWLLPAWLLQVGGLVAPESGLAPVGLSLAAMAVIWVVVGRWGPFARPEYVMVLYLGGYAMSVLGPALAAVEYGPRITALAISVLLYVGSAAVAREHRWLAPITVLVPVLLWQALEPAPSFEQAYGLGLVLLAILYLGVGVVLHHGTVRALARPVLGRVSPWGQPVFTIGAILAVGGLFRLAFQTRDAMAVGYALGSIYFILSALVFRQPAFGALAVATGAVAYLSALSLTALPPGWYGVGLVPGAALALLLAEVARRRLDRPLDPEGASAGLDWLLGRWSLPLDAAALGATFAAPLLSASSMDAWSAAWWGAAAMLGALALIRRQPAWLYPAIGLGLAGLATTSLAVDPALVPSDVAVVLIGPVWILIGLAWAFGRPRDEPASVSGQVIEMALPALTAPDQLLHSLSRSLTGTVQGGVDRWLRPVRTWGWVALLASTVVGAADPVDGLTTAAAYGLLVAFVAQSYRSSAHAWGAVALGAVAFSHWLQLAGAPVFTRAVAWTGLALAMALTSILVRRCRLDALRAWSVPLTLGSPTFGIIGIGLASVVPGPEMLHALAITTGGLGLSLFAQACYGHERYLLYIGLLGVNAGYTLELLARGVDQVQAFVLPAGLTLLAIAYLEWRRHAGAMLKHAAEDAALALLLGVSLVQALGFFGSGLDRYTYDGFLLLESAAIFGLGAVLHWRRPFFAGATVLVVDVGILLADPIRAMNTWYLVAAVGLVMIVGVILVEQRRQQIPLWLEGWRARLELWD